MFLCRYWAIANWRCNCKSVLRQEAGYQTHLVEGDTVVDEVQEPILVNGFLRGRNELLNNFRVRRVNQSQVDRVELGVVDILGGWGRGVPFGNFRLSLDGRWLEWSCHVVDAVLVPVAGGGQINLEKRTSPTSAGSYIHHRYLCTPCRCGRVPHCSYVGVMVQCDKIAVG